MRSSTYSADSHELHYLRDVELFNSEPELGIYITNDADTCVDWSHAAQSGNKLKIVKTDSELLN
jgi:hypothetical protein